MNARKVGRHTFLASTLVTIAAFVSGCGGGSAGLNLPDNTFTLTNIDSNANLTTYSPPINSGSSSRINGRRYFSTYYQGSFAANSRNLGFSMSGDPEIAVGDVIPVLANAGRAQVTVDYSEYLGDPRRGWSAVQLDSRQKGFVKVIALTNNTLTFEARNILMEAVPLGQGGEAGQGSFLLDGKGKVELTLITDHGGAGNVLAPP